MTEPTTPRLTLADAPPIGQYWEGQGGIYAGIMPDHVGTQPRFLIFATDEAVDVDWGGLGWTEIGARNPDNGMMNTQHLDVCHSVFHSHDAAHFASEYEQDGHKDFYLPSQRELDVAYHTLRENFDASDWYWSSTEQSKLMAYGRNFGELDLPHLLKVIKGRVRPVRSIPVAGDDAQA